MSELATLPTWRDEEWRFTNVAPIARTSFRLATPEQNMWLRTTLFIVEGHWGQGDVTETSVRQRGEGRIDPLQAPFPFG